MRSDASENCPVQERIKISSVRGLVVTFHLTGGQEVGLRVARRLGSRASGHGR